MNDPTTPEPNPPEEPKLTLNGRVAGEDLLAVWGPGWAWGRRGLGGRRSGVAAPSALERLGDVQMAIRP